MFILTSIPSALSSTILRSKKIASGISFLKVKRSHGHFDARKHLSYSWFLEYANWLNKSRSTGLNAPAKAESEEKTKRRRIWRDINRATKWGRKWILFHMNITTNLDIVDAKTRTVPSSSTSIACGVYLA